MILCYTALAAAACNAVFNRCVAGLQGCCIVVEERWLDTDNLLSLKKQTFLNFSRHRYTARVSHNFTRTSTVASAYIHIFVSL